MSKKQNQATEKQKPGSAEKQAATQPAQADPATILATDPASAQTTTLNTVLKQATEVADAGAAAPQTAATGPNQPAPVQSMTTKEVMIPTQPISASIEAESNGHSEINNGSKTGSQLAQKNLVQQEPSALQEESKGPAKTTTAASQILPNQAESSKIPATNSSTNPTSASKETTLAAAIEAATTGTVDTGAATKSSSQPAPAQPVSSKEVISHKPLASSTEAASSDHSSLADNGVKVGAPLIQSTPVVQQQPSALQEEKKGPAKGAQVAVSQAQSGEGKSEKTITSQKPAGAQDPAGPIGASKNPSGPQVSPQQNALSKNPAGTQDPPKTTATNQKPANSTQPVQPTNVSQKTTGPQVPANQTSTNQKPVGGQEPPKPTDASQKAAGAQDPAKPTSASQKPAGAQQPPQQPSPVISPEEAKQLEDLKRKIAEKKEARKAEEDSLQSMQRLVALKKQLDSQKLQGDAPLQRQNEDNSKLEQQLITLQVEVKREELIKELNTLKTQKKSEAIINTAMKKQETDVDALITDANQEEGKLESQKAELHKQITRIIPDQIKKCESEIQMMKAQKSRLTKEITAIKDKINEVNIQDVQLSGQGFNKLASQVAPASKANIDEADIDVYSQILDKISQRLEEAWKLLPAESIPAASPEKPSQLITSEKQKATPEKSVVSENQLLTPVIDTQKTSAFDSKTPISTNTFLAQILGKDVFANVQTKVQEAALAITKDKNEFVKREEQRKRFLEEDKLTSMKKIVEYEGEIEQFDTKQQKILSDIEITKTANALMQDTLARVFLDQKQLALMIKTAKAPQEQVLEVAVGEEEEVLQYEGGDEVLPEDDYVQDEVELREEDDFADDQVIRPLEDEEGDMIREEPRSEDETPEIRGGTGTIDHEGELEEF